MLALRVGWRRRGDRTQVRFNLEEKLDHVFIPPPPDIPCCEFPPPSTQKHVLLLNKNISLTREYYMNVFEDCLCNCIDTSGKKIYPNKKAPISTQVFSAITANEQLPNDINVMDRIMSTSIFLLDQNSNANDVDMMVFEPASYPPCGCLGNTEHMVRKTFYSAQKG